MVERYTRLTGLLAKVEAVYGTAETVFVATDGILCVEPPQFDIQTDNVERKLALPWLGNSEELPTTSRSKLNFKTELVGSGAAGTAPAWGKLLLGCGFSETISAGNRVEYAPINTGFPGLTQRFFRDGTRYVARGSRGKAKLDLSAYAVPIGDFEYWGFDTQRLASSVPAIDLTAFQNPEVVTDANSGDIRLGGILTAGNNTGGTVLVSKGMTLDLGIALSHRKTLGAGERIGLTGRAVTGSMTVELDAATEIQWATDIKTNVITSLGFNHGTVAGKKITVYMPRVQRSMMQQVDDDGNLMFKVDFRALPGLSGAPEIIVIAK